MKVVWTKQAEDSFNSTIGYLLEVWTPKDAMNFIELVDAIIAQIKSNPKMFKVSIFDNESREAVITKHTSMFYRELNKTIIEIEYFWNNYRNPEDLKKSVKNS
ncbi:type II toxin-antitoxin system RelE/ParE family toxin [Winogradskyella sp. A3E31]|uniref:type II toxin-antitoxin system RelE/ParE family toxin n=1 Tax=Winogradskyella sp. A3E31 TaxID=3349637 RepID=UPI00398ADF7F